MTDKSKYTTAPGMRMALEERLKAARQKTGGDIMRLRRHVAFDRFLARIFAGGAENIVAKGGYTLELRLKTARTTKDVDFSFTGDLGGVWSGNAEDLRKFLDSKAGIDLGDFFEYSVGETTLDLENAPYGGYRFPIDARMAGRKFTAFSIDIAAGDAWFEPHQTLQTHDWLGFAGIPPATIPVISLEQQFAEKLHSYTQPRDRENSRVKDLVDMVLIIREGSMSIDTLKEITKATFKKREESIWPPVFGQPPEKWTSRFSEMAETCGIDTRIEKAVEEARAYCQSAGIVK